MRVTATNASSKYDRHGAFYVATATDDSGPRKHRVRFLGYRLQLPGKPPVCGVSRKFDHHEAYTNAMKIAQNL